LLTVVFQQLYLWPNLTIAENISLVTQRNRYAPLTEIELAMLDRLNISEIAAKHPHHCSLGQRQRATVARALLTQARFLLMDEPTSALDRHNRTVMAAALSEARATGRGFLIISHDERDFESVATSTFELDGGVLRPL
jgi:ABC-type lipoprotein export system ATPase subunit